jgi:hypothetical protein
MKGDYVCGQFTLADACWAGVCQVAMNMGKGAAISSRSRLKVGISANAALHFFVHVLRA